MTPKVVSKLEKREFAPSLGLWPAKTGKGYTAYIDEKTMEVLATAQAGGRLFLQSVPQSQIEENDKSPHFRVVIFPPNDEPGQERL